MKLEHLSYKLFQITLGLLAVLAICGVDFVPNSIAAAEDMFRNGQARYLCLAIGLCVTWVLIACHPAWALFWGWSWVRWVLGDWQTYGMLDVVMIGGCLIVGDAVRWTFRREDVLRVLAWLAVVQATFCFIQLAGYDSIFAFKGRFENEAIGTLGHFTMVGSFIGLGSIIFATRRKESPANLALAGILFIAVVACHSTMALVGTVAGLWYLVWRKNRMRAYLGGIIAINILATLRHFYPNAAAWSFSGRLNIWPYVVEQWLKRPIIGHGPGSWYGGLPTYGIPETIPEKWYQAHNDFLQVLPEQGLIGLAIVIVGLAVFYHKANKLPPVYGALATALCVSALGNFIFHMVCFGLIGAWIASAVHHHAKVGAENVKEMPPTSGVRGKFKGVRNG